MAHTLPATHCCEQRVLPPTPLAGGPAWWQAETQGCSGRSDQHAFSQVGVQALHGPVLVVTLVLFATG